MGGLKTADKLQQAIEVFFLFFRVVANVDVIIGCKSLQVGIDEVGIIEEARIELMEILVDSKRRIGANVSPRLVLERCKILSQRILSTAIKASRTR